MTGRRLEGRVAVVTGAASGIGAASAERLAQEGAVVYVTDVDHAGGERVVEGIVARGGRGIWQYCDVAVPADWAALGDRLKTDHGHLDILHSNAYFELQIPLRDLKEEQWDRQMDVNLKATYLAMRCLGDLLLVKGGAVVLTSSVHALMGLPARSSYAAAKGGLCALGRQLAIEYGPQVRVNIVLPGPILTPAWAGTSEEVIAARSRETAAKRLGRADEVAAAVAFLASDDASYVTGASLVVDGGYSVYKVPDE